MQTILALFWLPLAALQAGIWEMASTYTGIFDPKTEKHLPAPSSGSASTRSLAVTYEVIHQGQLHTHAIAADRWLVCRDPTHR